MLNTNSPHVPDRAERALLDQEISRLAPLNELSYGTRSASIASYARLQMAVESLARGYGLDFFEQVFHFVPESKYIDIIAARGGFPNRYPFWKFGQAFDRQQKQNVYGLGIIYEMIINNDPCHAYMNPNASLEDIVLVMAHCYGHNDFFKNNLWFRHTDRKAIDHMADHGTAVRKIIAKEGAEKVERFLEVCLSLEDLIDPAHYTIKRGPMEAPKDPPALEQPGKFKSKDYMESWINPPGAIREEAERLKKEHDEAAKRFPYSPQRDALQFLMKYAPLEDWQRTCLDIVAKEAYYFQPQGQTKVMNEGWASYWHTTLMEKHLIYAFKLDPISFADHHSGTVHMPPSGFNPYKIGLEIFRDIEHRWDTGKFGREYEECEDMAEKRNWDKKLGLGREKIFEVRKLYNDVMFIDEFLTQELCDRMKLYVYGRDQQTGQMRIVSRDVNRVKASLLNSLTNFGRPEMWITDANYMNRGELVLEHNFKGLELKKATAVKTMENLFEVWKRPVHVVTTLKDEKVRLSYDGKRHSSEKIAA